MTSATAAVLRNEPDEGLQEAHTRLHAHAHTHTHCSSADASRLENNDFLVEERAISKDLWLLKEVLE